MQFLLTMLSLYPGSTERYLPFLPLLYNNTHSRGPRLRAGVLCRSWEREFTKRSRGRHDFAKRISDPNIVPRKQRTIPPISPSLYNTHRCSAPASRLGRCAVRRDACCLQKVHRQVMISTYFFGRISLYPRSQRILPFLPLLYNTHKQRAPA